MAFLGSFELIGDDGREKRGYRLVAVAWVAIYIISQPGS